MREIRRVSEEFIHLTRLAYCQRWSQSIYSAPDGFEQILFSPPMLEHG